MNGGVTGPGQATGFPPDGDAPDGPAPEGQAPDVLAAAAAAEAARATMGVVRLQPGIWGMVARLTRDMWERATGTPYPDTAGVDVELRGDTVAVEVAFVLHAHYRATTVVEDVQRAVRTAVTTATGLDVSTVSVRITEIDLSPLLS